MNRHEIGKKIKDVWKNHKKDILVSAGIATICGAALLLTAKKYHVDGLLSTPIELNRVDLGVGETAWVRRILDDCVHMEVDYVGTGDLGKLGEGLVQAGLHDSDRVIHVMLQIMDSTEVET